ncbi:MAG: hypothetical protein LW724_10485 [Planctomycetaceae bacterium]|nr:hypothetical protein [Planctomycetaceae bacterium]
MKRQANRLYEDGTIALADGNLVRGRKILDKLKAIAPESPMAIELSGDFARTSGNGLTVWYRRNLKTSGAVSATWVWLRPTKPNAILKRPWILIVKLSMYSVESETLIAFGSSST